MQFFRYHNTNCFFIENKREPGFLAIDAGWPCTLREYQRALKSIGIAFSQIRACITTHLHMDHAGLLGEFLESGIRCFLIEHQSANELDEMERIIRKSCGSYRAIDRKKLLWLSVEEMNGMLETEGFGGEIVMTDGHSPDSISYITEAKEAIIGDLVPLAQLMDDERSRRCWDLLKGKGVKAAYPSHADVFEL